MLVADKLVHAVSSSPQSWVLMHIIEFAAEVVWICFKLNQQQSFLQHSHDPHFPSLKFEQFLGGIKERHSPFIGKLYKCIESRFNQI